MIRSVFYVEELNRGGIETFCMNVLRSASRAELSVSFLVLKRGEYDYAQEAEKLGASIDYLIADGEEGSHSSRTYKLIKQMRAMRKWASNNKWQVDVLHFNASHLANAFPLVLAAKQGGIKKIYLHSHNSYEDGLVNRTLHYGFRPLLPFLNLSGLLACSTEAGEWMFGHGSSFCAIANGVNFQKFQFSQTDRNRIRNMLAISRDDLALIYVARFTEPKNHKYLIELFSRLSVLRPDAKLLLCGRGPCEKAIKELAKEGGIDESVKFLGVCDDIAPLLSASDCFVFPSNYEGLPVAAVEAQVNGLPLLLSDRISPDAVLSSKTLVESLDSSMDTWIDDILKLSVQRFDKPLFNPEIKKYNIDVTVTRLLEIYEKDANGTQ